MQVHFNPEVMQDGPSVEIKVAGLGVFNVRRGFGSWGALMHTIHQQRNGKEPANALKLYDLDGVELLSLDEVDTPDERHGGSMGWKDELVIGIVNRPSVSDRGDVSLFRLVVDVGLGYRHSIPGVRIDADCTALAKQVCAFQDICYLRKVLLTKIEAMVRAAIRAELAEPRGERTISLYDLEKKLGKAPDGYHVDKSHMERCLTCDQLTPPGGFAPRPRQGLPLRLEATKQLFVDDFLIDREASRDVIRVHETAVKAAGGKPVLKRDRPWEDLGFGRYPSVLHDGSKFRMWYRAWFDGVAYAESHDGIKWVKPELGLYDADKHLLEPTNGHIDMVKAKTEVFWCDEKAAAEAGFAFSVDFNRFPPKRRGRRNNIVASPSLGLETGSYLGHQAAAVTLDEGESDPRYKYKVLYECSKPNPVETCLAVSPDGLRFTPWNNASSITHRAADTYSQLVWDGATRRHLLYTRTDFGTDGGWREIRGHRTMSNPNLLENPTNWTVEAEWYLDREGKPERDRRQAYSITSTIYQGIHFGFLGVIQHPRDFSEGGVDTQQRHERDVRDVYLVTSRDGIKWDLSSLYKDEALIARGQDNEWDNDQVMAAPSLITWGGEHWIYYLGINERHDCDSPVKRKAIGAAKLPLDRFISLRASHSKDGVVETVSLIAEGSRLLINADLGDGGVLQVAVVRAEADVAFQGLVREESRLVPAGDEASTWSEVTWAAGHFRVVRGEVVRLRFHLSGAARLYGFQIA